MNRISSLYSSSIGKKSIAAVTGLLLLGFLVGHVAGNLKVFTGTSASGVPHIDEYGQFLKQLGEPVLPYMAGLWVARVGLLVCLVLHVIVVAQLAIQSNAARPSKYVHSEKVAASLPARWMMYSGLLILAFVVFHILHFTTGTLELGEFEHGAIYGNLFSSFSMWPVATGYIFVMLVLGLHLYHGVWSLFQTLGFDNPDRNKILRAFAMVLTIGVAVGFILVPFSFVIDIMPDPTEYVPELLTKE